MKSGLIFFLAVSWVVACKPRFESSEVASAASEKGLRIERPSFDPGQDYVMGCHEEGSCRQQVSELAITLSGLVKSLGEGYSEAFVRQALANGEGDRVIEEKFHWLALPSPLLQALLSAEQKPAMIEVLKAKELTGVMFVNQIEFNSNLFKKKSGDRKVKYAFATDADKELASANLKPFIFEYQGGYDEWRVFKVHKALVSQKCPSASKLILYEVGSYKNTKLIGFNFSTANLSGNIFRNSSADHAKISASLSCINEEQRRWLRDMMQQRDNPEAKPSSSFSTGDSF